MALGALLSVSGSLRAAQDMSHRYRATRERLVPKFEPAARRRNDQVAMKTEANSPSGEPPEAGAAPAGEKTESAALPAPNGRPAGGPERGVRAWWSVVRRMFSRRKQERRPGRSRSLVQQELELAKVKPCRNDLSDADWELGGERPAGARLAFLKNLAASAGSSGEKTRGVRPARPASRI